jgi:FKBP-type peptidyl-prolyl cis-trans isomerase (trigger factor)
VKIEIGKTEGVRRVITLTAEASEIETIRKSAIDAVRKHLKVPGFRPGKAPDVLVLQREKDTVNREFRSQLREQALRYVKLFHGSGEILAVVKVEIPEVVDDEPLIISVDLDLRPEFELPDYNHISVPPPADPEVSDEEIDEWLLKESTGREDFRDAPGLRADVRREIYEWKVVQERGKCRDAMVKFLCDSVDFPLPASLVEKMAIDLFIEKVAQSSMPPPNENEAPNVLHPYAVIARRTLKRDLIIEAIAEKESIKVAPEDMMVYLAIEANALGISGKELMRRLKKDNSMLRGMNKSCLLGKVIATLMARNLPGQTAAPRPVEDDSHSLLVPKRKLQQADDTESGSTPPCVGPSDVEPTACVSNCVEKD